jgi:hypothetical protein
MGLNGGYGSGPQSFGSPAARVDYAENPFGRVVQPGPSLSEMAARQTAPSWADVKAAMTASAGELVNAYVPKDSTYYGFFHGLANQSGTQSPEGRARLVKTMEFAGFDQPQAQTPYMKLRDETHSVEFFSSLPWNNDPGLKQRAQELRQQLDAYEGNSRPKATGPNAIEAILSAPADFLRGLLGESDE